MTTLLMIMVFWWAISCAAWVIVLTLSVVWVRIMDRIDRDITATYGFYDQDADEAYRDALMLSVLVAEMTPSEDLSDPLVLPIEWTR